MRAVCVISAGPESCSSPRQRGRNPLWGREEKSRSMGAIQRSYSVWDTGFHSHIVILFYTNSLVDYVLPSSLPRSERIRAADRRPPGLSIPPTRGSLFHPIDSEPAQPSLSPNPRHAESICRAALRALSTAFPIPCHIRRPNGKHMGPIPRVDLHSRDGIGCRSPRRR